MSNVPIPSTSVFSRVIQRDEGRCVYCDRDMLESLDAFISIEEDHVKPRSAGGALKDEWNRVIACSVCNHLKGNYDPWPEGPVTADTHYAAVQRAREYIADKRIGQKPNEHYENYPHWVAIIQHNRAAAREKELLMGHDTNGDFDLHDVLKQRVDEGEPIYIDGQTTPAIDATVERIAKEAVKPIEVVHIVDLSTPTASSK